MKNYSFWNMIMKTIVYLALLSIVYDIAKLTSVNDSGFFSLKYFIINTVGYVVYFSCLCLVITRGLSIYIKNNDKVLRKSGLQFGATALALSKFISVPTGAILVNALIPNLGPMSNTISILGFPLLLLIGGILGGVIGFIGELILKFSN